MNRILLAEDNDNLRELITDFLSEHEYEVDAVADGEDAWEMVLTKSYQLILLDVMMPGMDGFTLCRKIRERESVPVLFLTARVLEEDQLRGYELGADDYIMKPFDSKELVARVKAVLRRYQAVPKPEVPAVDKGKCVEYPGIEINLTNYSVLVDGQNVEMPPKELELLYFLASSPNQVFTREQLLDQIWGYEYIGDTRTVDVHIKRLREKIKDHNGWKLATVWGIGYKFEVK